MLCTIIILYMEGKHTLQKFVFSNDQVNHVTCPRTTKSSRNQSGNILYLQRFRNDVDIITIIIFIIITTIIIVIIIIVMNAFLKCKSLRKRTMKNQWQTSWFRRYNAVFRLKDCWFTRKTVVTNQW